jgi:hypothetical protein
MRAYATQLSGPFQSGETASGFEGEQEGIIKFCKALVAGAEERLVGAVEPAVASGSIPIFGSSAVFAAAICSVFPGPVR